MDSADYIRKRYPGIKEGDIKKKTAILFGAYFVPEDVLAGECPLLEKVLSPKNLSLAAMRVVGNGGAPGIDRMPLTELDKKFKEQTPRFLRVLYSGEYIPSPVVQKEIPKKKGGVRKLGIPTVADRLIQQAIAQVLTELYDPTFSGHSYGFRAGKSAKSAVKEIVRLANMGKPYAVAVDIEKFFDNVDHSVLLRLLKNNIKEHKLLTYIERYLKAGAICKGRYVPTSKGVPQGGPLSPVLSNIILNELDIHLEEEEISFARYADDTLLLAKTKEEAQKALEVAKEVLEDQLHLRLNEEKTQIGQLTDITYLGFTFKQDVDRIVASVPNNTFEDLKDRFTKLSETSQEDVMESKRRSLVRGWTEYFGMGLDPETGSPK